MKLNEWIEKIEKERLDDQKYLDETDKQFDKEYNSYISQYRNYTEDQLRDYGHTWGPNCESKDEKPITLKERHKVKGYQLEILKKMIDDKLDDFDIEFIFLEPISLDKYVIEFLGPTCTYETVLRMLVEKYRPN